MPQRALVEHRPWLLASLVAAIAYYLLRAEPIGDLPVILLKGAGAAFLTVYAWQRHYGVDAKLLALVMILSACGDMLIELSLEYGGTAFFASHIAAITLYLRNTRAEPAPSQKALAAALLLITPLVCWLLSGDLGITFYGFALGGMAATAWTSRFPRYRVGLGSVLFIISDWLIFLNVSGAADSNIYALLVWPLYYIGQFLIATGVIQTLRQD